MVQIFTIVRAETPRRSPDHPIRHSLRLTGLAGGGWLFLAQMRALQGEGREADRRTAMWTRREVIFSELIQPHGRARPEQACALHDPVTRMVFQED